MIHFTDGSGEVADAPSAEDLAVALRTADPDFWNGETGMSCLEYQQGAKDQAIYISLVAGRGYYLVFEFTDRSRIVAAEPGVQGEPDTVWWGGNPVEIPADWLVSAERAAAILRHFLATGDPLYDVEWRPLA